MLSLEWLREIFLAYFVKEIGTDMAENDCKKEMLHYGMVSINLQHITAGFYFASSSASQSISSTTASKDVAPCSLLMEPENG